MTATKAFPLTPSRQPEPAAMALATFVACAQLMLDPATPEALCQQTEARLLAQLPVLRALGVFDLFDVRDPALAALLHDELEQLEPLALRDARAVNDGCPEAHARRA